MKLALTAAVVFGLWAGALVQDVGSEFSASLYGGRPTGAGAVSPMRKQAGSLPTSPAVVDVIARSTSPLGVETLILRYDPPSVLLVCYTGPQGWFTAKLAAPNHVRAGYCRVSGECTLYGQNYQQAGQKCRFTLEVWDRPHYADRDLSIPRAPVWRLSVVGPDDKPVLQRGMTGEPIRSEANWPDLIQP